jgi:3-oxoacyl-[acyl-carrier protein] reductase
MQLELSGKIAVVSAGTKGIGRECVMALAREGARVALFSRDGDRLVAIADEIERETGLRPFTQAADLTDPASISRFFSAVKAQLGPVGVLVANSVGPAPGPFEKFGDEDWINAFEGAFLSTARMIREVVPQMREAGGGSVVAIQSCSVKQPIGGLTLSNGVRPGVAGLMKSLSMEYGQFGMRFNVVCPGRVMTDRFLQVEAAHGEPLDERLAKSAAEVPMRRLGKPAEVADAVLFLSSARASYITGSVLAVDGGNVRSLY